jgi:glycosyltransferase involved in cell wall biosynthesis
VIHFHNMSLLGPKLLSINPLGSQAVKLYTTHEHWLVCPTHVLWKYDQRPCQTPDCLRCILHHRRPPQLWRYTGLLDRMARHVDAFVSPSRFTAGMHAQRGFSQPVGHLPYFIERTDEDWMHPAPNPHPKPFFLFAGRLEVIKGLQGLIKIWEAVPDYDLLVAGTGTYEAELRKMAAGNPRIHFLGALSQAQMAPLFFHALACIIPSITYETFGMITIESFARKTPIIVRDLGAMPEVVRDAQGGLICATDDEFRAAIYRIASSPRLRADLGESGYRAFVNLWCTEAHLKAYFDLLRDVAGRKFGCVPWESRSTQSSVTGSCIAAESR